MYNRPIMDIITFSNEDIVVNLTTSGWEDLPDDITAD